MESTELKETGKIPRAAPARPQSGSDLASPHREGKTPAPSLCATSISAVGNSPPPDSTTRDPFRSPALPPRVLPVKSPPLSFLSGHLCLEDSLS
ncbi:hypothetical protein NL676_002322 [Syzygium grande]|nr:hypothetical protein NL676_002322 [Syzygium grande]